MADALLETIVAPVTAPGAAGVAIVRISGALSKTLLSQVTPAGERALLAPRRLIFAAIYQGEWHRSDVLDEGLVTFFPGPHSYTGEDVVEFHVHGSSFIVSRLLETLCVLGARLARAGEFTERAFENGKIDLTQAEAVADLILAETEIQARVAREQLAGKLSEALHDLGEPLRALLAEIEAHIDFPEEGIEPLTVSDWSKKLSEVQEVLRTYLASYRVGRLCREGALVVLSGLPNAGKSSLLNRLLGEERAIVTAVPGTTRDSIEERTSLFGLQVRFCDTAGLLEETGLRIPDQVERLGIERSWRKLEQADIVLFVFDGSRDFSEQREVLTEIRSRGRWVILVANKTDLMSAEKRALLEAEHGTRLVFLSALKGEGIPELQQRLSEDLIGKSASGSSLLLTNQRHVEALKQAEQSIGDAIVELERGIPAEFVSVLIRQALGSLTDIVGVTHNEEILGLIFSKFCIGK